MQEIERTRRLHALAVLLTEAGILVTVAVVGIVIGMPAYQQARDDGRAELMERLALRTRVLDEYPGMVRAVASHLSAQGHGLQAAAAAGGLTAVSRPDPGIRPARKAGLMAAVRLARDGAIAPMDGDPLDPEGLRRVALAHPFEPVIAPVGPRGRRS